MRFKTCCSPVPSWRIPPDHRDAPCLCTVCTILSQTHWPEVPQAVALSEGSLLSLPGCSALQFPMYKNPAGPARLCVLLPQRYDLVTSHVSGKMCCCYRVCKKSSISVQSTPSDRLAFFLKTKMAIKWLPKGKFKLKRLWKDGSHRKYQLSARQGAAKSSSIHRAG